MSLVLGETLENILAPHKAMILADAAHSLAGWTPPADKPKASPPALKTLAASGVIAQLGKTLREKLMQPVTNALAEQDMMEGDRPSDAPSAAAWDSELAVRLEKFLGAEFAQTVPDFLSVVSDGASIGSDLAGHLAESYAAAIKPQPMHAGKFLSKIGIVDADIKAAEAQAARGPASNGRASGAEDDWPLVRKPAAAPPSIPKPPAMKVHGETLGPNIEQDFLPDAKPISLDDLFGDSDVPLNPATVGAAAPLPAQVVVNATPPVPHPPTGKPDRDLISRAYQLWFQAGPGAEGLKDPAAALEISVGTLRNWTSGKINAKASFAQAQWMKGDCERRIADLMEALNIFAAVRD